MTEPGIRVHRRPHRFRATAAPRAVAIRAGQECWVRTGGSRGHAGIQGGDEDGERLLPQVGELRLGAGRGEFLKAGDVVKVWIEKIGEISTKMA